ncbi:hypothetical protein Ahy_A03g010235 isoform B [Arachis hypogaea]|uniref:Uncharacterized protein n=1 Tax=Arachis hypogaea TaxID=3818 RepID=A0A445DLL8_ARAHY|nr:hypothetical protein Ahy_A03g010235 isoform B [Arachis hypogaea]
MGNITFTHNYNHPSPSSSSSSSSSSLKKQLVDLCYSWGKKRKLQVQGEGGAWLRSKTLKNKAERVRLKV